MGTETEETEVDGEGRCVGRLLALDVAPASLVRLNHDQCDKLSHSVCSQCRETHSLALMTFSLYCVEAVAARGTFAKTSALFCSIPLSCKERQVNAEKSK